MVPGTMAYGGWLFVFWSRKNLKLHFGTEEELIMLKCSRGFELAPI